MAFFIVGEQKRRPGVYVRYYDRKIAPAEGADDGVCAAVFRSDWGPLDKAVSIENIKHIPRFYGGGEGSTTAVAEEQFKGGARRVMAVRLGSGGTAGSYQIMDAAAAPAAVIGLKLLYPGSKPFQATVRRTLGDPDRSEFLLIDGTKVLERYAFDSSAGADQAASLLSAFAAARSSYFTAAKLADGNGTLAAVTQAKFAPGTDPTIDIQAYSRAYEVLESYRWNVLAIDTSDTDVHMLTQMYLNRVYQGGKFVMATLGEPATGVGAIAFATRLARASEYNDYQVVYVGNGWEDMSGLALEGWRAAARVAGMIAGTPSSQAVTRLTVANAAGLTERLADWQIEAALNAGMLVFTASSTNGVWIEQGINTLVTPGDGQDDGWKKIKRVKVRFELFDRITRFIEPLIGRVNNDPDGRMNVVQRANDVCDAMVAEGKLLPGAHCEVDPAQPPRGDSAWFLVFADDIDALEKAYFAFGFRFAPDEA